MSELFTLESAVSYWDVDRDQRLTLGGVFKLLQEAAIKHADVYGLGAKVMAAHGESWVLNRVAVAIDRYPVYEDRLKVVTWSAGIRGFRGYRELRVYRGEELVVTASTLWLYINLAAKTLARVPEPLAARFPTGQSPQFRADLEKRKFAPLSREAPTCAVTLRYSDFDGNAHLNNTAYVDCLQTALAKLGHPPRPREVEMQFMKEVPPTTGAVTVAVGAQEGGASFAIAGDTEVHAQGVVRH
jgi:medium-chain acyl-[acyl-carrier-protein] hydrolase